MPENKYSAVELTSWLNHEPTLIAARLGYLMRERGLNSRRIICAKIFPNMDDPTGGVVITEDKKIYQFSFNRAGMRMEDATIDEWVNLTDRYNDHLWRDDILEALRFFEHRS